MNELTPLQCQSLLTSSSIAHLAVVDDGAPYVTPISYVMIGDALFVRTSPGRRIQALRTNPKVCIEVSEYHDDTGDWESVVIFSTAEFVEDDRVDQEVISAFFDKYRNVLGSPLNPGSVLPHEGVTVRFPIDISTGRTSGSYFSVRTRPGLL
ncbi:MAG TPA: pyridoxamine 5'-phosphate oxidase family protein [Acidimicrobiia bacterium]|nr:pyridoxamine 5'-phosphate oxidase family protein [Acidimicrobiia bacterium]